MGTQNIIYLWKMYIYLYIFKLQSPSKYSPFDGDAFSTAQNNFSICQFWFLLVFLPFFVSHLPHRQNVSLWETFSSREPKKITMNEVEWIGKVGHGGHGIFGPRLLNTRCGVGRCAPKSPIIKWAMCWIFKTKIFTEAKCSLSQQCQLVHWYRWVPRTLIWVGEGGRLYYKGPTSRR